MHLNIALKEWVFKNNEKYILFYWKNSFWSEDILMFIFSSSHFFP